MQFICSGCPFACKGCYNKVAQNFKYGKPYTENLENQIIEDLAGIVRIDLTVGNHF